MEFVAKIKHAIIAWLILLDVIALLTTVFSTLPWSAVMLVLVIVNTHVFSKALNTPLNFFEGIETFTTTEKFEIVMSLTTNASFNGFNMWQQVRNITEVKKVLYKSASIVTKGDLVRVKGFEHVWAHNREDLLSAFARYLDITVCDSTENT